MHSNLHLRRLHAVSTIVHAMLIIPSYGAMHVDKALRDTSIPGWSIRIKHIHAFNNHSTAHNPISQLR